MYVQVLLRCHAMAYPRPTIAWKINGTEVNFAESSNIELTDRGDLKIKRVKEDSAGSYECLARNDIGSSSAKGELMVVSTTTISQVCMSLLLNIWYKRMATLLALFL